MKTEFSKSLSILNSFYCSNKFYLKYISKSFANFHLDIAKKLPLSLKINPYHVKLDLQHEFYLKSNSPLPIFFNYLNQNHLKMMKNGFYFFLKALFVFEIFYIFVLNFWLCRKTA